MLVKSLIRYQPVNIIIFLLFGIILWTKTFVDSEMPGIYIDKNPMPVYEWIVQLIGTPELKMLCKIIAFILTILQGLITVGIINQYNLIGIRSYLPGILFLIITANLPEYQLLNPVMFANLFLLIAWNQIIRADQSENSLASFFNASFFIGLATLFYPNYVYFILIILASTFLNRIPNLREFGMILAGTITVWYFYLSLFLIFTNKFQFAGIEPDFSFSPLEFSQLKIGQVIFIIYFGFLVLLGSIQTTTTISNQKIQIRRNLKFLFLWFILGLLILFFTNSTFELIYLESVPTAILLSLFFSNTNYKWIKETAFILLVGITIINQYFPLLLI
jgi:hypothetical protein